MAKLTINIPTGITTDVLEAIAADTGFYNEPATSLTKSQWAKAWLKNKIKEKLVKYRNSQATEAGKADIDTAIEQAKIDGETIDVT